jgi:KDO2-lipid IV(A) lauroyltransferase
MDIIELGLWMGKHLSQSSGHRLARLAGSAISLNQNNTFMLAIKANQWVASAESLNRKQLVQLSRQVMQNDVVALFDFFYYYHRIEECKQRVRLSPSFQQMLTEGKELNQPQILLGPHLGAFDLMGLLVVKLGLPVVILSYPNPNGTYKTQNKIRKEAGMRVLPISLSAFREAKQALKHGESLVTGIDRPIESDQEVKYQPKFFGRPAPLPTFYVRMALESNAAVRVVYGIAQPDNTFLLDSSAPIAFEKCDDLKEEYILNAEKVLKETEKVIIKYSDQWSMLYPIWPEVIPQIKQLK